MKIERRKSVRTRLLSKERRRGIVLLVVISLLALFILMGITFALVSSQYQLREQARKGDRAHRRPARSRDGPDPRPDPLRHGRSHQPAIPQPAARSVRVRPSTCCFRKHPPQGRSRATRCGDPSRSVPTNVQPNQNGNGQLFTFTFRVPLDEPTALPTPYFRPFRITMPAASSRFATGLATNHSSRIVAYTPGAPGGERS